jgi:hypothetical protein
LCWPIGTPANHKIQRMALKAMMSATSIATSAITCGDRIDVSARDSHSHRVVLLGSRGGSPNVHLVKGIVALPGFPPCPHVGIHSQVVGTGSLVLDTSASVTATRFR